MCAHRQIHALLDARMHRTRQLGVRCQGSPTLATLDEWQCQALATKELQQ
jgi:hypothetical protein